MDCDPQIILVSRRILDKRTFAYVDNATGFECGEDHENAVILDMQTANLLMQLWPRLEDKSIVQRAIDMRGVAATLSRLWKTVV